MDGIWRLWDYSGAFLRMVHLPSYRYRMMIMGEQRSIEKYTEAVAEEFETY